MHALAVHAHACASTTCAHTRHCVAGLPRAVCAQQESGERDSGCGERHTCLDARARRRQRKGEGQETACSESTQEETQVRLTVLRPCESQSDSFPQHNRYTETIRDHAMRIAGRCPVSVQIAVVRCLVHCNSTHQSRAASNHVPRTAPATSLCKCASVTVSLSSRHVRQWRPTLNSCWQGITCHRWLRLLRQLPAARVAGLGSGRVPVCLHPAASRDQQSPSITGRCTH